MSSSAELAWRDPALSALMGIQPRGGSFGSDFNFGDDFGFEPKASAGADFGWEPAHSFGGDYMETHGEDEMEDAPGADMGAEFGAQVQQALKHVPPHLHHHIMKAHHHHKKHQHMMRRTAQRVALLEPNKGSLAKVEGYGLAVNQTITVGGAIALTMTQNPDCYIRPKKVTANAPTVAFATISEIKVGNVSGSIGGIQDAYDYNANAVQALLDLPTISPATRVTVLGGYTGLIPPPFVGGSSFPFAMSFKGPASMVQ